jgi:hypothetical protein
VREGARIALGVVAAPLVPAAALAIATMPVAGPLEVYVFSMVGWAIAGYVAAIGVALVLGLPLFFLLRRFGLAAWWSASIAGFAFGAGAVLLITAGGFAYPGYLWLWGATGAAAALLFWAIWQLGGKKAAVPAA